MSTGLLLGLALALVSTVVLDVGYLLQQRDAAGLPDVRLSHPFVALRGFLGARRWLIGVGLTGVGFFLYLAALVFADLSLVQTASASGVALLAVIAVRWFGQRLSRTEVLGVTLAALGLASLGLSLIGHGHEGGSGLHRPGLALWIGVSVLLAGVMFLPVTRRVLSAGVAAGLAAGFVYGAADISVKGCMVELPSHYDALDVLSAPLLYVLLALYGVGFVLQQLAFQRGDAVAAIGAMVAATNASPIAAGVVVFGDQLPSTPAGLALRISGFALAIAGSILLARVSEGGATGPVAQPATTG